MKLYTLLGIALLMSENVWTAPILRGHVHEDVTTTDCENCSDWTKDAEQLWSNHQVPGEETNLRIIKKRVVITTKAVAKSICLDPDTLSQLVVRNGGRLLVGEGGIVGATQNNLIIEEGGMLCFAPTGTNLHPQGQTIISASYARRKNTAADQIDASDLKENDFCWHHFACPVLNGDSVQFEIDNVEKFNPLTTRMYKWAPTNEWQRLELSDSVKSLFSIPFGGYTFTTLLFYSTRNTDNIHYTFKGPLAGNKVLPLQFTDPGFSAFGNSYLAPLQIEAVVKTLSENTNTEPTAIVYNHATDEYEYVNKALLTQASTPKQISALTSYFLYANAATSVSYDYKTTVWDDFHQMVTESEAPTRTKAQQEGSFDAVACVHIEADEWTKDHVWLFNGSGFSSAIDRGYDATKMERNNKLQIYAEGPSSQHLAVVTTNSLDGTALTFTTTDSTHYTMSFSDKSGEKYAIYDAVESEYINIGNTVTYTFEETRKNQTISDRFTVHAILECDTTYGETTIQLCASELPFTYVGHNGLPRTITGPSSIQDTLVSGAFNGCDSVLTVHFEVLNVQNIITTRDTLCLSDAKDKYPKLNITGTGTYYDTLRYIATGCDSVYLVYHIRIAPPSPETHPELDNMPASSRFNKWLLMIQHKALVEQGYQFSEQDVTWYLVKNTMDTTISMADDVPVGTGYSYTADQTLSGHYYALINDHTTDCGAILRTVVLDCDAAPEQMSMAPSSVRRGETITLSHIQPDLTTFLSVYNPAGKLVSSTMSSGQVQCGVETNLCPGMYLLRVNDGEQEQTFKYIITQ